MYEIKSRIKWSKILFDLGMAIAVLTFSIYLYSFNNFITIIISANIGIIIMYLWRLQSHKIRVDDAIYFNRHIFKNYRFDFEDIKK